MICSKSLKLKNARLYTCEKTSSHVGLRNLGAKRHEKQLRVFGRKVMGTVHGNKNRNGSWRIRTNEETDLLIRLADIIRRIKADRI